MTFRPLQDRILVRRIDAQEKTAGGLIIPDSAKEKPQEGEVLAIGTGLRNDKGELIPAIEALNRDSGRGLRDLPLRKETLLGSLLADTRFFDPRYRRSAQARLGLTSRHLMLGAGLALGGALLWRHLRRQHRAQQPPRE